MQTSHLPATAASVDDSRFVKSSTPIVLQDAVLALGRELELDQRVSAAAAPVDPRKVRPHVTYLPWQGQRTEWHLSPTSRTIAIAGRGCSTSFGIIGAPGTGKTHLIRKLLRGMIGYAPDRPEKRFGGLILDPKGSLIDDVRVMLAKHPREDDLVVIDGSTAQVPVDILASAMNAPETARLLVLAAQSAGISAREPFWFIAWTNLFAAAITLLEVRHRRRPTLDQIVTAVLSADDEGRREIEQIASAIAEDPAAWAQLHAGRVGSRSVQPIEREILQAVGDIRSFYRAKRDYISTVEAFIIAAYGQFRTSRCTPFCTADVSAPCLYDAILESGKIVVVSLPPDEPGLAKTLCTLVKCMFQQTVLSRKRRFRDGLLNNWDRVVFLACDEYSEIASEVPGHPTGDGRFFALAREYGCLGILATQSVHVLENSSLREAWRSVFSNFAAKVFMGLGDAETAQQATELAGKLDWQMPLSTTSRSAAGPSVSVQRDIREREIVPAHLLTHGLQIGDAIVIGSLDGRAGRPEVKFIHVDE